MIPLPIAASDVFGWTVVGIAFVFFVLGLLEDYGPGSAPDDDEWNDS